MQIDLPDQTIDLANQLASGEEDAAAVIGVALTKLAWERQEIAAVQEGIDAYQRGDHEPYEAFAERLFRELKIERT